MTEVQDTVKPEKKITRLTSSSKILKVIINAIHEKKGEDVVSLDLRKISEAVADFFIICEAGSNTQVRAIADAVEAEVKKECGEIPYRTEGQQSLQWVLVDYVNVVVHIFQKETRKFYRLEEMWHDGVMMEHEDEAPAPVIAPKKKAAPKKAATKK